MSTAASPALQPWRISSRKSSAKPPKKPQSQQLKSSKNPTAQLFFLEASPFPKSKNSSAFASAKIPPKLSPQSLACLVTPAEKFLGPGTKLISKASTSKFSTPTRQKS